MENISETAGGGQTACDCSEARFQNKRGETIRTGVGRHSCEYVEFRNSLLPAAAAFADSRVPDAIGGPQWSRLFNKQLQRLMRAQDADEAGRE